MISKTLELRAGFILQVSADENSNGTVRRIASPGSTTTYPTFEVTAGDTVPFGPFTTSHVFKVISDRGELSISIAEPDVPAPNLSSPMLANDGAPANGVQASLTTSLTGADNDLVFTAVAVGTAGNGISVEYVDPGDNDVPLSVEIIGGKQIKITLATDSGGTITTTAGDIAALTELEPLVTVANSGADDGTGLVTEMAQTFLADGENATGHGTAGKGSICVDYTNGALYLNTGDSIVPAWKRLLTEDDLP